MLENKRLFDLCPLSHINLTSHVTNPGQGRFKYWLSSAETAGWSAACLLEKSSNSQGVSSLIEQAGIDENDSEEEESQNPEGLGFERGCWHSDFSYRRLSYQTFV